MVGLRFVRREVGCSNVLGFLRVADAACASCVVQLAQVEVEIGSGM